MFVALSRWPWARVMDGAWRVLQSLPCAVFDWCLTGETKRDTDVAATSGRSGTTEYCEWKPERPCLNHEDVRRAFTGSGKQEAWFLEMRNFVMILLNVLLGLVKARYAIFISLWWGICRGTGWAWHAGNDIERD